MWTVKFTRKAAKQAQKLDSRLFLILQALVIDLQNVGPYPGKAWNHYSKFKGTGVNDKRHCHLACRHPTYVCCWQVYKSKQMIEVYYVGTHEKAPY